MSARGGLRTVDSMLLVALSGVMFQYIIDPELKADPRALPTLIRNGSARVDSSYWLCPTAVCSAAGALLLVVATSRFASGGKRLFLEGWALAAGALLLYGLRPPLDGETGHITAPLRWLDPLRERIFERCNGLTQGADVFGCGWEVSRGRASCILIATATLGAGPLAGAFTVLFANGLRRRRQWADLTTRFVSGLWLPVMLAPLAWFRPVEMESPIVAVFLAVTGLITLSALYGSADDKRPVRVTLALLLASWAFLRFRYRPGWDGIQWNGYGRAFEGLALLRFPDAALGHNPDNGLTLWQFRILRFLALLWTVWLLALVAGRACRLVPSTPSVTPPRMLPKGEPTHA